jgi:lysophospholipase L1-like esterase
MLPVIARDNLVPVSIRNKVGVLRRKVRGHRQRAWTRLQSWGVVLRALAGADLEIWIGDSHASHLNISDWPVPAQNKIIPGRYVRHLGPRLMFSVARDGFPPEIVRLARRLGRFGRGEVVILLVVGEIDIRCHLAPRLAGTELALEFPATYVEHGLALGALAKANRLIFVVPVPPSDEVQDAEGFPVAGTLAQRLDAFSRVRAALHAAVDPSSALLLDATPGLADATGSLRSELSFDGCHVNEAGRVIVRSALDTLLLRQDA